MIQTRVKTLRNENRMTTILNKNICNIFAYRKPTYISTDIHTPQTVNDTTTII